MLPETTPSWGRYDYMCIIARTDGNETEGGVTPPFFVRSIRILSLTLHSRLRSKDAPTVNPAQKNIADEVRDLTNEIIAGTRYFLVDVEVRGHKGTRVVEVYLDSTEDFGHDDLAVVSKELGFLLDVEDTLDDSYKLEVSSPGIKRPLQVPQQYQKNVGRTLRVRYDVDSNEEIVVGELMAADEQGIDLELASGERLELAYDAIIQARIELPW